MVIETVEISTPVEEGGIPTVSWAAERTRSSFATPLMAFGMGIRHRTQRCVFGCGA
jgi:hypothetical protein